MDKLSSSSANSCMFSDISGLEKRDRARFGNALPDPRSYSRGRYTQTVKNQQPVSIYRRQPYDCNLCNCCKSCERSWHIHLQKKDPNSRDSNGLYNFRNKIALEYFHLLTLSFKINTSLTKRELCVYIGKRMSWRTGKNFYKSKENSYLFNLVLRMRGWLSAGRKNSAPSTFGYSKWIGLGFKVQWCTMGQTLLLAYNIDEIVGLLTYNIFVTKSSLMQNTLTYHFTLLKIYKLWYIVVSNYQ